MKWFQSDIYCETCGVAFKPRADRWGKIACLEHARPHLEIERRRQEVIGWATNRWEALEVQMLAQRAEESAKYQAGNQAAMAAMAQQSNPNPYMTGFMHAHMGL